MRTLVPVLFLSILLVLTACTQLTPVTPYTTVPEDAGKLKQLATEESLNDFLKKAQDKMRAGGYGDYLSTAKFDEALPANALLGATESVAQSPTQRATEHSTTNVQVKGVDEADIIKNDGKYVYIVAGNNLIIVDAFPPEDSKIIANLNITNATPNQLFINENRLVLMSTTYAESADSLPSQSEALIKPDMIVPPGYGYGMPRTVVTVYDTTDKSKPKVVKEYTVKGNYYNSRMIGDYVYVIAQDGVPYGLPEPIPLPGLFDGVQQVATSPVHYFDSYSPDLTFNNIVAVNINKPQQVSLNTYMLGYANTLYVSSNNIYIAHRKEVPWHYYTDQEQSMFYKVIVPVLPKDMQQELLKIKEQYKDDPLEQTQKAQEKYEELFNALDQTTRQVIMNDLAEASMKYEEEQAEQRERTIVHKLSIDEDEVEYKGKGEIKGTLLNQFSLDEYKNYLRVATTTYVYGGRRSTSYNNVYVLDKNLEVVGEIEKIAPDERIYSTRFMGDRLYMVTFKQIDPFFVIDLRDPEQPKILGELKIPGFSDYLHPYDANHIIGIGKETQDAGQGRVTTAGLKLALFDVSDVNKPKERAKIRIGLAGSDSEALRDHKAFLFDKKKNLLVLPVQEVKDKQWRNVWQGAYVLGVTPETGFTVRGKVSHTREKKMDEYDYDYEHAIKRSLYMDDTLYTLSYRKLEMHDLNSLNKRLASISLPYTEHVYYLY